MIMEDVVERVQAEGMFLGGRNRFISDRDDFVRLIWMVPEDYMLVVVYTAGGFTSASLCDDFEAFKRLRNSPTAKKAKVLRSQEDVCWHVDNKARVAIAYIAHNSCLLKIPYL